MFLKLEIKILGMKYKVTKYRDNLPLYLQCEWFLYSAMFFLLCSCITNEPKKVMNDIHQQSSKGKTELKGDTSVLQSVDPIFNCVY